MTNKEMTYYRLYLKDYLLQQGDSRANDDDFINDRSARQRKSMSRAVVKALPSGRPMNGPYIR